MAIAQSPVTLRRAGPSWVAHRDEGDKLGTCLCPPPHGPQGWPRHGHPAVLPGSVRRPSGCLGCAGDPEKFPREKQMGAANGLGRGLAVGTPIPGCRVGAGARVPSASWSQGTQDAQGAGHMGSLPTHAHGTSRRDRAGGKHRSLNAASGGAEHPKKLDSASTGEIPSWSWAGRSPWRRNPGVRPASARPPRDPIPTPGHHGPCPPSQVGPPTRR